MQIDGVFGTETENAVKAVQRQYGLPEDGVVGELTWKVIYDQYLGIIRSLPYTVSLNTPIAYPGYSLSEGSTGDYVLLLQEYMNILSDIYPEIAPLPVTGVFATLTRNNVLAFQRLEGLEQTGVVDEATWNALAQTASDILNGNIRADGQYA